MSSVLKRTLLIAAAVGGTLFLGIFAAFWFFPGQVFRWAASFAGEAGLRVELPVVRGNPASGWSVDHFSLDGGTFSMTARRVYVNVDWRATLLGRPSLDALWVDGLSARATAAEEKKKEDPGVVTLPAIHNLRVVDGRFSLEKKGDDTIDARRINVDGRIDPTAVSLSSLSADAFDNRIIGRGTYDLVTRAGFVEASVPGCLDWPGVQALDKRCVRNLSARVNLNGEKVEVERVSAFVSGSTVTATGRFVLAPFSGVLDVASRGPFVVNAHAEGDPGGWVFRGEARAKENALRFAGAARFSGVPSYEIDVRADDIPADLVPGLPPALGFLSGHLEASASGRKPADLDGKGTFRVSTSNGPEVSGTVQSVRGLLTAEADVSKGGVDGLLRARWSLGAMSGEVQSKLSVKGEGLRPWAGISTDGDVNATLKGRWPTVAWRLTTDLSDFESGPLSVERIRASGSGEGLNPPEGNLSLNLSNLVKDAQKIDSVQLTVEGSMSRHELEVSVDSNDHGVRGEATGAYVGDRWTSKWSSFAVTFGESWTAREPFSLSAGPNGASVSGLRLVSGDGRINVDGGVERGVFNDLRVRADGVAIAPIVKAAGSQVDIAGRMSLNASVAGRLASPQARVSTTVRELKVAGKEAGTLTAEARLTDGRVFADVVTLTGPAGTLDADGSFPITYSGKRSPPIRVRIRTAGLDPSALPMPSGVSIEKSRMDGDLTIVAGRGEFEASGRLAFVAGRLRVESQGLDLADVDILLQAEGRTLRVARAVAKTGKKGTVSLDGTVSASDVAMALRARNFSIDHPSGVSARSDADLTLSGTWDVPRVVGTVDILEMDVRPEEAKKKEEKATSPAPAPATDPRIETYSPLSADVRIVFDDNVWYKDGQSSIEFEGNLNVQKESGGPARVYGTVSTVRGDYVLYGRSFEVANGQIAFLGQAPPDPTLNVRATYVTDDSNVKIHMDATGTLSKPELKLTSEPPMEETDIVSVLVTGKPRGQGGSEAMSESAARMMAANYIAERLRSRLQGRMDVDQLKFNLTEEGAAEVMVGQNVTDDLYVSYGRTLGAEGERRLTAEYTLTPRWSLFGTTSSVGRYVIDLLFKFGYK